MNLEFSFLKADLPFKNLSRNNPHGWGIGYYKENFAKIQKEPFPAIQSKKFEEIARNENSKMFISHVRYSTQGEKTFENTHPFIYDNWIFAHNGNIDIRDKLLELLNSKFKNLIKGKTDSEVYFYWLMQNIEDQNDLFNGIKKSISFIQSNKGDRTTGLNFVLINGEKLIALRKALQRSHKYSLYYSNRKPDIMEHMKFQSNETRQLITSKNLKGEEAVLVCSEPLTEDENWIELNNNQLLIVEKNLKLKKWDI